jgi:hypothetical protein
VGAAGTEGFGPALCRTHTGDVEKNHSVRNKDSQTRYNYVDTHYNENHQLIDGGACARELQERRDVTHVMIDDAAITEGESQHGSSMGHGTHKPHCVHRHCHHKAELRRHGDPIKQRFTDGHISIIGH